MRPPVAPQAKGPSGSATPRSYTWGSNVVERRNLRRAPPHWTPAAPARQAHGTLPPAWAVQQAERPGSLPGNLAAAEGE
jgi:hypothetical protein